MNEEHWTDPRMEDLRNAVLLKVVGKKDLEALSPLVASDFGMSTELLPAYFSVIVESLKQDRPPPKLSFKGLHQEYAGKSLPELVAELIETRDGFRALAAVGTATSADGSALDIDKLLAELTKIKASTAPLVDIKNLNEIRDIPEDATPWVWESYLRQGDVALLVSPPFVGKSELLYHLLPALLAGKPFFGKRTLKSPVFILTEENDGSIQRRLKGDIDYATANRASMFGRGWLSNVALLDGLTEPHVIFIDSLARFIGGVNENQAFDIGPIFNELLRLARTKGHSFVVTHHTRKTTDTSAYAARGSGDIPAAVDMVLTLKKNDRPTQRVLSVETRHPRVDDLLIELMEDGTYRAIGEPKSQRRESIKAALLNLLGGTEKFLTRGDVVEALIAKEFSPMTIYRALTNLTEAHVIDQRGKGTKNDPHTFGYSGEGELIEDEAATEEADAIVVRSL